MSICVDMHSFPKYLLNISHVLDAVERAGAEDSIMSKADKNPILKLEHHH